jgi:hypothetical protein
MKLTLLSEGSPRLIREDEYGDAIVRQQSAKDLVVNARKKMRNVLGRLGLTKSGAVRMHEPIEAVPAVHSEFSTLLNAATSRAKNDARDVMNGHNLDRIGQFWGVQLPTGYYDVEAGQRGKQHAQGIVDKMIMDVARAADGKPVETKAQLLLNLADNISR